jgi:hypothetical protein
VAKAVANGTGEPCVDETKIAVRALKYALEKTRIRSEIVRAVPLEGRRRVSFAVDGGEGRSAWPGTAREHQHGKSEGEGNAKEPTRTLRGDRIGGEEGSDHGRRD